MRKRGMPPTRHRSDPVMAFLAAWRHTGGCFVCGDPIGADGVLCADCTGAPASLQQTAAGGAVRLHCGCEPSWRDLGGVSEVSHLFTLRPVACIQHGDTYIEDLLRIPGEVARDHRLDVAMVSCLQGGKWVVKRHRLSTGTAIEVTGVFEDRITATLFAMAHIARCRLELESTHSGK